MRTRSINRPARAKVFGIGFHKTGTTTLGAALSRLGYRVCGTQLQLARPLAAGEFGPAWQLTDAYDAFRDNPWPLLFRQIDERYPGSRFVMTVRDPDSWLRSVVRHFGHTETEMRQWIYGAGDPIGNEETYRGVYLAHCDAVRSHFRRRQSDLLEISWEAGGGWDVLCEFLGLPAPGVPFPHLNAGAGVVR